MITPTATKHKQVMMLQLPPLLILPFLLSFPSLNAIDIGIGIGIGIGGGGENPSPSPSPPSGCPPPPPAEPQPSDFPNLRQYEAYKVIQRFKNSLTCDPNHVTANWVGSRPCTYYGFACETPPNLKNTPTIASVDFNGFGLCAPTLAGFLDKLPDLAIFHANSNNLTGTIPDLTSLPFLYELDFSNNKFSGQFPSNLLLLNQLLFLDLRFNFFVGAVPSSVFQLFVDVLFLNNNGFSQQLPADLGKSPVGYLTFANNKFTGPIPPSICNTSNTLLEVLFLNNQLSGCLPFEIGLLKVATVFDAGLNRITGPIPLSFGCLKKIEQLNLAGNLLYGNVPSVLCSLAMHGNLVNLSLSDNYFTSVGISCWQLIKNKVLDVRKNCIVGLPDQRPAWECVQFFSKPKFCPILTLIPCELNHWAESRDDALPLPSPVPVPAPVVYNALNRQDGN